MNHDFSHDEVAQAKEASRTVAIQLLDYLEVFHSRTNPPVRDISKYDLFRLERTDLPDALGVKLTAGGDTWLSVELHDLPVAPKLPDSLTTWVAGSVSPNEPPTLRNPDPLAVRLINLAAESQSTMLEIEDLDDLDEEGLAALGLAGIDPGGVTAATIDAIETQETCEVTLAQWVERTWSPWSTQWQQVQIGRDFYKRLYELRSLLERDGDLYELVWGFSQLRWKPQDRIEVRHPLFLTPVEVTLNDTNGELSVEPVGPTQLEIQWSMDLSLADARGLSDKRNAYAAVDLDPWTEGFLDDIPSIVRLIDLDGVVVDNPTSPGLNAAVAPAHWALYLRRRETDYRGFLEAQRDLYGDTANEIPDPFASLVMDEPSRLNTGDPTGEEPDASRNGGPDRLLLPLPSNAEQERILQLAQHRAGVTAKGPPGTGKSHTIANLIAHFTANGQRVLVTAAKEQALQVLIDKVPAEIRDLCVPAIGTDAAARSRLQASIGHISSAAGAPSNEDEIERLEERLRQIDEQTSLSASELAKRRATEAEPAPLRPPGYEGDWTPSAAATWLNENADRAGLLDAIDSRVDPPLSDADFNELVQLLAGMSETDAAAASKVLPTADLPDGAQLSQLWFESEQLSEILAAVDSEVLDWKLVDAVEPAEWSQLAEQLDSHAAWLVDTMGSWTARVHSDATDSALAPRWTEFVEQAGNERENALAATRTLAAHSVEITAVIDDPRQFLSNIEEAKRRLAEGRSIGITQRAVKKTLQSCQVNGMTPRSVDDLDLVLTELQRRSFRDRLSTRWMNLAADFDLPLLPGQQPPEFEVGDAIEKVASVLDWETHIRIDLLAKLEESGLRSGEVGAPARLTELAETARTLRNRARSRQIEAELDAVMSKLNSGMQHPDASPIWGELHDATTTRQLARWNAATSEARRLTGLSVDAARRNDLRRRFVDAAPLSAKQLGSSNGLLTCGLAAGWHWRQLEVWLDELDAGTEPSKLQEQLEQLSRDRRNVVTKLVAARAWDAMTRSIDDRKRQALNQFTEANRRLGKGTGKYGAVWKQEIRKALENAQDAVPVWIMPIHKVISTFRPTAEPPFDVVIIDEASQVGLLQLVVLGLAKRAIVVGDEKQTSPGNVGVHRQPLLDAMDQHLGGVADRYTRFNPDLSLYDIARQRFPDVVQLTEHFRCLPRIIEFSNHRWYDGSIVPLRDKPPHQGWESLGSVYVPTGTRTKGRDDNPQEARAVVDLIAELTSDTRYDGMTFGVITLFSGGQGALITQLLLDRFGPEFMERRQLRVSDPAGFQGDERDIIIYSLVVAPNEKTGAMTDEAAHRRINVAASRGVNQTWMVHSVRADAFRDDDPRRWLLEYATTPPVEDQLASNLDKADSDFERRVLRAIEAAGYRRVFAQYPVGRFSIDIVIEGPETRLAVECDGDRWHGPDKWADDYARQQILERAGWTFERIRGSAFYRNPSKALEPLWQRLKDLGIPKGDWDAPPPSTTMHRIWPQDFAADTNQTLRATRQRPADESEHSGIPESSEIPELPLNLFEAVDQTLPPSSANPGTNREIRRWARGAGYEVEDKGRIAPEILSAWLAAHPGRTLPDFYEPIDASATGTGALLIVPATNGEVRRWARSVGLSVGDRGRLHPDVINAWNDAFPSRPFPR